MLVLSIANIAALGLYIVLTRRPLPDRVAVESGLVAGAAIDDVLSALAAAARGLDAEQTAIEARQALASIGPQGR